MECFGHKNGVISHERFCILPDCQKYFYPILLVSKRDYHHGMMYKYKLLALTIFVQVLALNTPLKLVSLHENNMKQILQESKTRSKTV